MGEKSKAVVFSGALFLTLIVIFEFLAGRQGVLVGFFLSVALIWLAWFGQENLLVKLYGAVRLEGQDSHHILKMTREISKSLSIKPPKVFLIPSGAANGFGLKDGRGQSMVFLTQGVLVPLDEKERSAILTHLVVQSDSPDLLLGLTAVFSTIWLLISDVFCYLADFGNSLKLHPRHSPRRVVGDILRTLFAPLAAGLVHLSGRGKAILQIDKKTSEALPDPMPLAKAIWKLDHYQKAFPLVSATQGTSHLFLISPLVGDYLDSWFCVQPKTTERIKRLIGRNL